MKNGMKNLLSANFYRLWRSKSFWGTLAAMFGLCLGQCLLFGIGSARRMIEMGYEEVRDRSFFYFAPLVGAFLAVFVCFFLGTEYSDGTIRSKLTAGYRRWQVYFANFLTCFVGSWAFLAAWWTAWLPLLAVLGPLEMGPMRAAEYALAAMGFFAVYTAIFTALASCVPHKALAVLLSLIVFVGLFILGSRIVNVLDEPEFYSGTFFREGELVALPSSPNPRYVAGRARAVCEFFQDLLPSSQALRMARAQMEAPSRCGQMSAVLTVCVCALGAAAFRRKDIK